MEKTRSKNNRTLTITEEEKADKSIQGYDGVFWERNSNPRTCLEEI